MAYYLSDTKPGFKGGWKIEVNNFGGCDI